MALSGCRTSSPEGFSWLVKCWLVSNVKVHWEPAYTSLTRVLPCPAVLRASAGASPSAEDHRNVCLGYRGHVGTETSLQTRKAVSNLCSTTYHLWFFFHLRSLLHMVVSLCHRTLLLWTRSQGPGKRSWLEEPASERGCFKSSYLHIVYMYI